MCGPGGGPVAKGRLGPPDAESRGSGAIRGMVEVRRGEVVAIRSWSWPYQGVGRVVCAAGLATGLGLTAASCSGSSSSARTTTVSTTSTTAAPTTTTSVEDAVVAG